MMRFCAASAFTTSSRGKSIGLQLLLIDIDLDLAHLAAIGRWNGGAGNGRELRPDEILRVIEKLGLRQLLLEIASCRTGTLDALKSRTYGGVMPGGRNLSTVCEAAVTCASRGIDVDGRLKEDLDDPVAVQRLGFDMLDVVDL